jgi:hypothetical protein
MNQYLFLRRMRAPIMLLTFGITAILDEYAGISYAHSWPLYIIVWGLLKLAENAILAQNPPQPGAGYPGYPGYQAPAATGYTSYTGVTTADPSTTSPAMAPPPDIRTHEEEGR